MTEGVWRGETAAPLILTPKKIQDYMRLLRERGLTPESLAIYRRNMDQLYDFLPEDKAITRGTMEALCGKLAAMGYAPQTINSFVSVANGLVAHLGRKDLQTKRKPAVREEQPALTREEYRRLLTTARDLGLDRAYLLVKVFATLGITTLELHTLTVEAAKTGVVSCGGDLRAIPDFLRRELLYYADRHEITRGSIFRNAGGRPMSRTRAGAAIKDLSWEAKVDPEKCTPRCLKKLYHQTRQNVWGTLTALYEAIYQHVLEQEEKRLFSEGSGLAGTCAAGNDSTADNVVVGAFRYQAEQDGAGRLSFRVLSQAEAEVLSIEDFVGHKE